MRVNVRRQGKNEKRWMDDNQLRSPGVSERAREKERERGERKYRKRKEKKRSKLKAVVIRSNAIK